MARNLVQKNEEAQEVAKEEVKQPETPQVEKVNVITMEQLIVNRLDVLTALVVEGFKQVGVKFEGDKK